MSRIDAIIEKLSLSDKLRQLTQTNAVILNNHTQAELTGEALRVNLSAEDVWNIGSVLNFTYRKEAQTIQKNYMERTKNDIPLMFMADVIHGYRTIFPIPLAMGCSFEPELLEDCARMSAVEARLHGVQATFSPMVDLVRDASWGRVMETTGEDPYLNGEMGKAFIRGYHKGGLACCVKHFAAYGAAESGKDYNVTELSDHALREFYLRAYEECMKEKPDMVMSSFNLLNGIPVNGNKELLVDRLRGQWGFDGVLISDYNAIREMIAHGYLENDRQCAGVAANNEIDIEMCSETYINALPELVQEGVVSEETIDRMLRRVLMLKEKMGLLDDPYAGMDFEKGAEVSLCGQHRELARIAAEKSAVLLKNQGVLPLKKEQKIALIGPFADDHQILGAWRCEGQPEEAVTIRQGVEALLGHTVPVAKGCSDDLFAESAEDVDSAIAAAQQADTVVVCMGEAMRYSGEARSRADISVPKAQVKLLQALKALGKPVVCVLFGGRPQVLTQIESLVDAILCVWMPGTEGGNAIANLLYGNAVPSGKLTMAFPRTTGQCPVYYNHFSSGRPKIQDTIEGSSYRCAFIDELNKPLYPFGFGLSYTQFALQNFVLSADTLKGDGSLTASVTVENVGDCSGDEVIQLYIHDHFASMVRPVQELKGFQKISLKPREKQTVSFEITKKTLEFYGAEGKLVTESGKFTIMLGNSSDNVSFGEINYEA